jgi:hypothetical protein
MILILIALLFSNSFAASCLPLMIKAGLYTQDNLSSESAVDRYFQYLKYFVRQGAIGLEELKILKGFSTAPNPIALFGDKINENYIYRDNIEALRPLIKQSSYRIFLEQLISELMQEAHLKQEAHETTETVEMFLPEFQVATIKSTSSNAYFGNGFVYNPDTSIITNLITKKDSKIPHFVTGHAAGFFQLGDDTYLLRTKKFNDISEVNLYDANTAQLAISFSDNEFHSTDAISLYSRNNLPALAWARSFPPAFHLRQGENFEKIIPALENRKHNLRLSKNSQGELYGLIEYFGDDDSIRHFIQVFNLSQDGKLLFEIDVQEPETVKTFSYDGSNTFSMVFDKKSRMLFHGEKSNELLSAKIIYKDGVWSLSQPTHTRMNTTGLTGNREYAKSIQLPDHSYVHLIRMPGRVYQLQKDGAPRPYNLKSKINDHEIINFIDGIPHLIAIDQTEPITEPIHIVVVNLRTFEERVFLLERLDRSFVRLQTSSFTQDHRLMLYFTENSPVGVKIFSAQVYGPFDPKTGETVP